LNNSKDRSLKIKLDFLSEGNHMAEVYSDAADAVENPNNLTRKTQQVKNGETLEVHLASGGGQVLRIVGM
jgi:alpha-glucosidase